MASVVVVRRVRLQPTLRAVLALGLPAVAFTILGSTRGHLPLHTRGGAGDLSVHTTRLHGGVDASAPLLSVWTFVALVTVAVAATAGFVASEVVRRRRRRRGTGVTRGWRLALVRAGAVLGVCVLASGAALEGVNRHYGYIPTVGALFGDISPDLVSRPAGGATPLVPVSKLPDHGVVEKVAVSGAVSGIEARDTYVYLPPAYLDAGHAERRFPVLYLIHGSPGVSADWLRAGYVDRTMDELLRQGAIEPFIVVLPDVNGGYRRDVECEDVVNGPQAQTYLVEDVVRYVDEHYRTVPDRSARAIGGLSTGGYCGLNLTMRHPDVFSAAISHSGYGRPDHNFYTGSLFSGNRALERANTPDDYAATIPLSLPLGVYLDAGLDDRASRFESARLYEVLRRRGVAVTYNVVEGESHTFGAWRRNLILSLPWASEWFRTNVAPSAQSVLPTPSTPYLPPEPPPPPAAPLRRPVVVARCRPPSSSTTSSPPRPTTTAPRVCGAGSRGPAVAPPTTPTTRASATTSTTPATTTTTAPTTTTTTAPTTTTTAAP